MSLLKIALTGLLLAVSPFAHAASSAKPNVVVILADDLGYGDVQALNPSRGKIQTPHLDRLAAEGMSFTDAHSGSSVCTPTRYGLLTGRYAWRSRLQRGVIDGFREPLLTAERQTLPAVLKREGYHTAIIGKWHLGFTLDVEETGAGKSPGTASAPIGARTTNGPLTSGFDVFYGVQHARSMGTFFEGDRAVAHVKPVDALGLLTRRAVEYVRERARSGRPFFLYFALTSPHTPIVPSAEWRGKSGLGDYADFVMETDWAVGEVLKAIDEANVADQTVVLASSDNGCSPQAGTDRLETQGHFASAHFRGYKADIWEGGHRVPFLVRWPGQVRPGTQSSALVCMTDVFATVAEMLNVRLSDHAAEDSISFLAPLLGRGTGPRTSIVHHSIDGRFAIREGPWKLALCSGSGGWSKPRDADTDAAGAPSLQLYDLSRDPAETNNQQATRPEVVARLRALLDTFIADGRSTPGPKLRNDMPVVVQHDDRAQRKGKDRDAP